MSLPNQNKLYTFTARCSIIMYIYMWTYHISSVAYTILLNLSQFRMVKIVFLSLAIPVSLAKKKKYFLFIKLWMMLDHIVARISNNFCSERWPQFVYNATASTIIFLLLMAHSWVRFERFCSLATYTRWYYLYSECQQPA